MDDSVIWIAASLVVFHALLMSSIIDSALKKQARHSKWNATQMDKLEAHLQTIVWRVAAIEALLEDKKNRP